MTSILYRDKMTISGAYKKIRKESGNPRYTDY